MQRLTESRISDYGLPEHRSHISNLSAKQIERLHSQQERKERMVSLDKARIRAQQRLLLAKLPAALGKRKAGHFTFI